MSARQAIDAEVIAVFKDTGTVLDWEGLLYGYMPNWGEDEVRAALRRCVRRGDLVRSPYGRRGFYIYPEADG